MDVQWALRQEGKPRSRWIKVEQAICRRAQMLRPTRQKESVRADIQSFFNNINYLCMQGLYSVGDSIFFRQKPSRPNALRNARCDFITTVLNLYTESN